MPPVWRVAIELVGQRVGARVEVVIVLRLVDANAPEHDGGMVPVAANHAADVVDRQSPSTPWSPMCCQPGISSSTSRPTSSQASRKWRRLRVVRRADDVAVQAVAKDVGVAALHARRHGLAYEGKRLMTVEPDELDDFAVEREAMIGEHRLAKTDGAGGPGRGAASLSTVARARNTDSDVRDPTT